LNSISTVFNFAYKTGNYELIVAFATRLFSHHSLQRLDEELMVYICWSARAFVELKDPQSINGLKSWLVTHFGVQFGWLDCAEALADGR
jgi:hypothetical protein